MNYKDSLTALVNKFYRIKRENREQFVPFT